MEIRRTAEKLFFFVINLEKYLSKNFKKSVANVSKIIYNNKCQEDRKQTTNKKKEGI